MNCPNCNKSNPEDATKCECGYVFKGYQESKAPDVTASRHSGVHSHNNQNVTVTDIKMEFGAMVEFIFKWTLASIPTALFFGLIIFILLWITNQ